jgi:hypothetical protein
MTFVPAPQRKLKQSAPTYLEAERSPTRSHQAAAGKSYFERHPAFSAQTGEIPQTSGRAPGKQPASHSAPEARAPRNLREEGKRCVDAAARYREADGPKRFV